MTGVVDAADLSLNVSREILQQDRQIRAIRRRLTKKIVGTVGELRASRPDDYATFWRGSVGCSGGPGQRPDNPRPSQASAFTSTHAPADAAAEAPTSIAEYVGRMKSGQDAIYYDR